MSEELFLSNCFEQVIWWVEVYVGKGWLEMCRLVGDYAL